MFGMSGDGAVPIAKGAPWGILERCSMETGKTEGVGHKLFLPVIETGDAQNIAAAVPAAEASHQKVPVAVIAMKYKSIAAQHPAVPAQRGKIFEIQLDTLTDGIIREGVHRRISFLHLKPSRICAPVSGTGDFLAGSGAFGIISGYIHRSLGYLFLFRDWDKSLPQVLFRVGICRRLFGYGNKGVGYGFFLRCRNESLGCGFLFRNRDKGLVQGLLFGNRDKGLVQGFFLRYWDEGFFTGVFGQSGCESSGHGVFARSIIF